MTTPIAIKCATDQDLPMMFEHMRRHVLESGNNGDLVFTPFEEPNNEACRQFVEKRILRLSKDVTQEGWERDWILCNEGDVFGKIRLCHHVGLKSTLHRAIIMMGIERPYRRKGFGKLLMLQALAWARQQPSLGWVTLNVFSHNLPARHLYRKLGFKEIGVNHDLFRVHGQKIDDIEMSLKL